MKIEDGKGSGRQASVSSVQRLNVSAKTQGRIFYASRDFGLAYNAVYDDITAASGDIVAYLKNTSSTRNLFVTHMEFHSVENVKWKIFSVSGTAASGATVIPSTLNLSSGIAAEAEAMSGDTAITGLTTLTQIGTHRSQALGDSEMHYDGALMLGPGDAIAIEYDTGTTGLCSVDVHFFFEGIGQV